MVNHTAKPSAVRGPVTGLCTCVVDNDNVIKVFFLISVNPHWGLHSQLVAFAHGRKHLRLFTRLYKVVCVHRR